MYSPLNQFKINYFLDLSFPYIDISISLISILIIISWILILGILKLVLNNKLNKILFMMITLINNLNKEFINVLTIYNTNYLPFVLFIFFYTLISNLLGLIPYSFTLTSQISITFFWSSIIMISVTIIGIKKHSYKFIYLFIPNGVPIFLIPFIMIIEILSYLSRVLSLAIRLSVNMSTGHLLIFIIAFFGFKAHFILQLSLVIPILILILILETGVSIIQAYVLSILIATYIKDSILLH